MTNRSRDPARIPVVLERLRAIWEEHPDLRLGQLVMVMPWRDPFYMEDDELLKRIEHALDLEPKR